MVDVGYYALLASVIVSVYGMVAPIVGARKKWFALVRSGENAVVANFVLVLAASINLVILFLTDQFQVRYVASNSSFLQPLQFKLSAFWGGQAGSLLLWAFVLALFSMLMVVLNRDRNRRLMPYATAVVSGMMFFFAILLTFVTSPFELLDFRPVDGTGLNPILQNYYMMIHPPTLFLGYVGLAIPYALAMGALMAGIKDVSWVKTTRRWTLLSWIFLMGGFTLGGMWAYEELGWGGFWAWDPVENASFMPWLVGTAFLHSIMITEKKGMLKIWNFVLILIAYELTIFGTFITRSGVVSSVHSFALSGIGPAFAVFLSATTFFGLFWIFYRSEGLQSKQRMNSFLSREASFLLNNWLFISICFAIFWGTCWPMVSEWITGTQQAVTAPFFNRVNWPLGLALLILTGICPLIAWRKASWKNFKRNFLIPLTAGFATGVLLIILGLRHWIALAFFSSCAFVAMTIFFEFYKGARARQTIRPSGFWRALVELTLMNKRRYGGFIIHAGIVVLFVGIIASSYFGTGEMVFTVQRGQTFELRDYEMTFNGLFQRRDPEKQVYFARIYVERNGASLGEFYPQRNFYSNSDNQETEVAIRRGVLEDLYLVLSTWDAQGNVTFRVFVNPLVNLVWLGMLIMLLGGFFVLIPDRKLKAVMARARQRQEEVRDEAAA